MTDQVDDDAGAAFEALFRPSPERAKVRLAQERKAGRTPKQRARKAKRTVPVSFRVTPECKAMIDALAESFGDGSSQADVIHDLVLAEAKRRKLTGGGHA